MSERACGACAGRGIVVGWSGVEECPSIGGMYPREVEARCEDCGGSGVSCCVGCHGVPEVEDLEEGQPWCTSCWMEESAQRRARVVARYLPMPGDDDDLPF